MDPFLLFKLPLFAWRFWSERVGVKPLLVGAGASTLAVVMYGCVEGGNW